MKSNTIKYYSTNGRSPEVTFKEALLKGLAPDGGLYLPVLFPTVSPEELQSFSGMEYYEIAFAILNKYIGNEMDGKELLRLCADSYNFEVPIEKISRHKYIMRLDQGPTASFKDFAARMMSRLMQFSLAKNNQHLTILTATSGDTGSAVANAFYGLKNIKVIILFPAGEVTPVQRKQMTTLQKNITVLEVSGKFDDCQRMVKKAFLDTSLSHISLSSANSINIGRLLPQSVYYFYSWSKLAARIDDKAVFSVPSGNFGNLMAGLIAARMGLPVKKFIISTNANDEVPEFLRNGIYKPISPSINCISSAMNVGHPSNLPRIIAIYGGMMDESGRINREPDIESMRSDLYGVSVSDDDTRETIAEAWRKYQILLEPHGAIAWKGIKEYSKSGGKSQSAKQLYISLETANPAKFSEELLKIVNFNPPLPLSMEGLNYKEEKYITMDNDYPALRELILKFAKAE